MHRSRRTPGPARHSRSGREAEPGAAVSGRRAGIGRPLTNRSWRIRRLGDRASRGGRGSAPAPGGRPRRRDCARAQRARGEPLAPTARRRTLGRDAARRLGSSPPSLIRRGRCPVPEVSRRASRPRRGHRACTRGAHSEWRVHKAGKPRPTRSRSLVRGPIAAVAAAMDLPVGLGDALRTTVWSHPRRLVLIALVASLVAPAFLHETGISLDDLAKWAVRPARIRVCEPRRDVGRRVGLNWGGSGRSTGSPSREPGRGSACANTSAGRSRGGCGASSPAWARGIGARPAFERKDPAVLCPCDWRIITSGRPRLRISATNSS